MMANMCHMPLDVGANIIDILAHDERDTNFKSLKTCSLVSRSFLPLCRKHIFTSITINKPYSNSPTIQLVEELLALNPELVQYVQNLDFCIRVDDLSYPGLQRVLDHFTRIRSLTLWHHALNRLDWQTMPPSARSAFLHLMHLPTVTFLRLRNIQNFSIHDLVPCTSLMHLQIDMLDISDKHGGWYNYSIRSAPKPIRIQEYVFGINGASSTSKLVQARCSDGLPVISFTDLKRLSGECDGREDLSAVTDILKGVEGLIAIHLKISELLNLRGFARILASSMRTLKSASFAIYINDATEDPLAGLCEELEEMRGKNVLETLAIRVMVLPDADCKRGHEWGNLDAVLSRPGWNALSLVSLHITVWNFMRINADMMKISLDMLLDTQFVGLSSRIGLQFMFKVEVKAI